MEKLFAKINSKKVTQIIVADSLEFCKKIGGEWVEVTGKNVKISDDYDKNTGEFCSPQPFPSWVKEGREWKAPKEKPQMEGSVFVWDESILDWVVYVQPVETAPVELVNAVEKKRTFDKGTKKNSIRNKIIAELAKAKQTKRIDQIKSTEIEKLDLSGRYYNSKYDIEVEILGATLQVAVKGQYGVQLFAKAWKDGKQLGFGKDGTIEQERFRIFNPPTLIDDPNGDIKIQRKKKDSDEIFIDTYREDPVEAIREVVAHNALLAGKVSDNIKAGTIGNTTDTFYPSVDGYTGYITTKATWANKRANVGNYNGITDGFVYTQMNTNSSDGTPWQHWLRAMVYFDTSSLADTDVIDSATFSLYYDSSNGKTNDYSTAHSIVGIDPASNTTIANADYSKYSDIKLASDIAYASINTSGYTDWTLNGSGLGNINKTGKTTIGLRLAIDVDNSDPSGSGTKSSQCFWKSSETSGTSNDPKLVVVHSSTSNIEYLVVGGGGGGGSRGGGGGGAGGYRSGYLNLSAGSYSITVGAGGNGGAIGSHEGSNGGASSIGSYITADGGGGGGAGSTGIQTTMKGLNGASGGGAGGYDGGVNAIGGGASYPEGRIGGNGTSSGSYYGAGGGGGSAGAGGNGSSSAGGTAGAGTSNSISGSSVTYATGGVGSGSTGTSSNATANTGNGGDGSSNASGVAGYNGGSGIVIIKYLTSAFGTCTGGTITTSGSYTIHTFTSSGTLTLVAAPTQVQVTKSLKYTILRTPTAPTKSLKYTVKTTPSAKTKSLQYVVKTTASAITKSVKYCIKITPSAKTKSLQYSITVVPSGVTKSLQYCVKYAPSATTKSLQYEVKTVPSATTKSLQYAIKITTGITKALQYCLSVTPSAITKSLQYEVRLTRTAITKSLQYTVKYTPSAITKSLQYEVKTTANAITKSIQYCVKATPSAITKSLWYCVIAVTSITKSLQYEVRRTPSALTKSDRYAVKVVSSKTISTQYCVKYTPSAKTKSLKYAIYITPSSITKSLIYKVKSSIAKTKSLQYEVKYTPLAITKSLAYEVRIAMPHSITKTLGYKVANTTKLTKSLQYYVLSNPYRRGSSGYSRGVRRYTRY